FYTIVTRDTRDQDFSANRQLFLTEQGYRYTIEDAETLGLLSSTGAGSRKARENGATANGPAPPPAAPERLPKQQSVSSACRWYTWA
ncbi:MAG TPA: hypothetical protein VGS80_12735, partial [Ktedonobacterales bacterium]|nr:hypothetical protein [Ktedonobacterales bacterium]